MLRDWCGFRFFSLRLGNVLWLRSHSGFGLFGWVRESLTWSFSLQRFRLGVQDGLCFGMERGCGDRRRVCLLIGRGFESWGVLDRRAGLDRRLGGCNCGLRGRIRQCCFFFRSFFKTI